MVCQQLISCHLVLQDMVQQQIEIELSVHAAAVEFLSSKASTLQEDASAWHNRREDDARAKERELEVRGARRSSGVG